jgi:hypothetical protein
MQARCLFHVNGKNCCIICQPDNIISYSDGKTGLEPLAKLWMDKWISSHGLTTA